MKLTIPAKQLPLKFMGLSEEDSQAPKKEYGTDEQKLDENGKPLYTARGLQAIALDESGNPTGADKSVSLNIRSTAPVKFGEIYVLTGNVTVTHYVGGNGRMAVSITADGFEPEKPQVKSPQSN